MLRFGFNLTNCNTSVVEWVNKYYPIIVQIVEASLRELGFEILTTCIEGYVYTYIYTEGKLRGSINISKLLMSIVAPNGLFDNSLANDKIYASIKVHKGINTRIMMAKIIFASDSINKSNVSLRPSTMMPILSITNRVASHNLS